MEPHDDGTMTEVPCTYDPMSQLASFTITRASLYVVGVNKQWTNPFSDVSDSDWFYGAVEHASRNGLFTGTGADTFTPSGAMTRAMLWTVLGRLDGQILSGSEAFDAAAKRHTRTSCGDHAKVYKRSGEIKRKIGFIKNQKTRLLAKYR